MLTHKRRGDKIPYPVNLQRDGNVVTWIISDVDTAIRGDGTAQLMYMPDDTEILAHSTVVRTKTLKSNYEIGSTPDPYDNWMAELTELAGETAHNASEAKAAEAGAKEAKADTEEHANTAAESAQEAKRSEDGAKESETKAKTSEDKAKRVADSLPSAVTEYVRNHFDELKGDKGDKGEKGDKGDAYIITEQDKIDIAEDVESNYVVELTELKKDLSQVSDLVKNTKSEKFASGWQLGHIHGSQTIVADNTIVVSSLLHFKKGEIWTLNNSAFQYALVRNVGDHAIKGTWVSAPYAVTENEEYFVEIRKADRTEITSLEGFDSIFSCVETLSYIEDINKDLSSLKDSVYLGKDISYVINWHLGYIHSGLPARSDGKTIYCDKFAMKSGKKVGLSKEGYKYLIINSDFSYLTTAWQTEEYTIATDGEYYIEVRLEDNSSISDVNIAEKLMYVSSELQYIEELKENFAIDYMKMFHTIGIVGDSLSSGECYPPSGSAFIDKYDYSWLSNICRSTGAECKHFSKGGLTTKTWLDDNGGYKTALLADTDCKAFFIALGSNDKNATGTFPLGTASDVSGTNSFVGYYKQIIELIHSHTPNAPIFLLSLYQVGKLPESYTNMVKEIARQYSYCYFIDFIGNCDKDIIITSSSTAFTHGSHYTGLGYIRVAETIKKIVNKVISNNLNDFKFYAFNN